MNADACKECGGPILLPPHPGTVRQFCSMNCHVAWTTRHAKPRKKLTKETSCPDIPT